MRHSAGRITLAIIGAIAAATAPGPAGAETLADAITAAYRTNPQLQSQRATTRATDEQLTQAKSAYGPTVTARASHTYSYERAYLDAGRQSASGAVNELTASVDQPVFTFGRLSSGIRVATANIDTAREALRLVESDVLLNVVNAYVSVRRDQQLLGIAQENLDLLTRQRGDTQARLRGREATSTDLAQTELRYQFALARTKEAMAQLEVSKSLYLLHVGNLPGALAPMPPLVGLPGTIEQAYDTADSNNPELLGTIGRERATRAAIGQARADFAPIVSLQATGGRGTLTQFSSNKRDFFSGGVVASVPVFNSGLTSSRVREAQARNDAEWQQVDLTRRQIRQAVAQSWDRMVAIRGTIVDYRRAVEQAELAYAGAREQERAGVRTTLDVLDQTRDLLDARTALADAEANEYLSRASLLRGMGLLEAPRLAGAPAYDPAIHLRQVRGVLVPPYQPLLHAVDAVVQGREKVRPPRDAAAATRQPGLGPLPAEPDVSPVR